MVKISIVTPVLNLANHIERCILSVAEQGDNVEHIIIDGGSTDGTIEIIKKHEDKLAYWTSESDAGQSQAINKGLAKSTGEIFNWLNADDCLTPNALEEVERLFKLDVNVIIGQCEHVNPNGKVAVTGSTYLGSTLEDTLGNYGMSQPSHFYRTEIVRKLGGLNETLHYCMDMQLWFKYLVEFGLVGIEKTEMVLSEFLLRSDAKSAAQSMEMKDEHYQVYKALLSHQKLPLILSEFFENLSNQNELKFEPSRAVDWNKVNSNFAWHLMLSAYERSEMNTARELFRVVSNNNKLSVTQKLFWRLRLLR